ncbi:MAG: hypothetical protein K2O47_07215 [Muribaculaceae bacterium]|nr:hypothetical protein [Muribaculaceae bacterium]
MNINQIDAEMSKVSRLNYDLSASLRRPTRRTLSLIDKAIALLMPFENSCKVSKGHHSFDPGTDGADLLSLLATHRQALSPYLDISRIESNLKALLA